MQRERESAPAREAQVDPLDAQPERRLQLQRAAGGQRAPLPAPEPRAPGPAAAGARELRAAAAPLLALERRLGAAEAQPLLRAQLRGQAVQDEDELPRAARPAVQRDAVPQPLGHRPPHRLRPRHLRRRGGGGPQLQGRRGLPRRHLRVAAQRDG